MGIRQGLVNATLLGWIGVVVILFRVLGPRRAGMVAVFGGSLFLPAAMFAPKIHPAIPLMNTTATGLGLLVGMVLFGKTGRARPRLHAADLFMMAFALAPALGFAIRGVSGPTFNDLVDTILNRTLGWLVPYAFARHYLADRDGPRDVALAVVASGVLYLPVVVYETLVGPEHYLLGLIYRIPYNAGMVERLGGWRPEGFFNNGIVLAAWMAISAVAATWLAMARERYPRRIPGWVPAAALLLGAILCRGMYGFLLLGAGLLATVVTQVGRTRWAIIALASLTPAYIGLRISGAWDAHALIDAAGYFGRPDTVAARINAEDGVLNALRTRGMIWGDGANLWASGVTLNSFWPDGRWLFPLWLGGLVGLSLYYAALHLVPIGVAISRPTGRPTRAEAASPLWCLATLSALNLANDMHNGGEFVPTILMAGTIVAASERATASPSRLVIGEDDPWPRRLARLALVAFLLALPELVGLLSGLARR